MNNKSKLVISLVLVCTLIFCGYVISILWRVSVAEQECFGRSTLIPLSLPQKKFIDAPTAATWWSKSFVFNRQGKQILVWPDEINGFQHIYGSALADFELGDQAAHLLFCGNEFAEAACDWNGITWQDVLDRRKDLAHNMLGRRIGMQARALHLTGNAAEKYLIAQVIDVMDKSPDYYPSFLDPRVQALSERSLGCRFLPRHNEFNFLLRACGVHDPDSDVPLRL